MQKWMEKLKGGKKDQILILFMLGILLLVVAVPSKEEAVSEPEISVASAMPDEIQILEEKLQNILSHVEGIGKTEVMLTLRTQGKKIVEKDVEYTQESEESNADGAQSTGGSRSEYENTVYENDSQGNEIPCQRKSPSHIFWY